MSISTLRWPVMFVLASSVAFGACSSGKGGGGNDAAAGSGGGAGGGGGGSAGGAAGGSSGVATMFLSDGISSAVYRYALTPGANPVLNDTITVTAPGGTGTQQTATGIAMSPAGELFVADFSTGAIFRVLSPLGTPATNGSAIVSGIGHPEEIQFVDDELWVPNVDVTGSCSTTPESIVRVAFDTQGNPSAAGTLTTGLVGANRGMLWVPATRDLYVSQCSPVNAIQHYRVAADHTATALTPITGNGLSNPHGMVVTPWGELLVSNPGLGASPTVLRFMVDAQGNTTPNGAISGNGLDVSIGLAFTPWGELFAVDQATATISRFTFDSAHTAVANGTFPIPGLTVAFQGGLGWILIVPGASSAVDGGADAASD